MGTKNWGVRLVSISAFTYFVLPCRQALGDRASHKAEAERYLGRDRHCHLTEVKTCLLWLLFIVGLAWSISRRDSN